MPSFNSIPVFFVHLWRLLHSHQSKLSHPFPVLLVLLVLVSSAPQSPVPSAAVDYASLQQCRLLHQMKTAGQSGTVYSTTTPTTLALSSSLGDFSLKRCSLSLKGTFNVLKVGEDLVLQQVTSSSLSMESLPPSTLVIFRLVDDTGIFSAFLDLAGCPPLIEPAATASANAPSAVPVVHETWYEVGFRYLLKYSHYIVCTILGLIATAAAKGFGLFDYVKRKAINLRQRFTSTSVNNTVVATLVAFSPPPTSAQSPSATSVQSPSAKAASCSSSPSSITASSETDLPLIPSYHANTLATSDDNISFVSATSVH